ncbi:prolyl oligopeptidase family serine peptidase [Roseococcus sp. SDR]|uniref:alpha/beta hydrolase family protein n=1 Tax=Roseococcus sp. SDR TaxID=2835532 RepID=UPI001BD0FFB3|nr:prolyl oligopeptidase family serine peptidase [Roseococcus sp. SDR]MBS7792525.1 prolyl oligopeptidase family serine peptidase [Roseococcus sp. SDR]MBV1847839.1 prolyl oligopeptidase family serine peptidase [Roseococcus sp. SDR]
MHHLLAVLCFLAGAWPAQAQTGFALIQLPDPGGALIETAIWYPGATGTAVPTRVGAFTQQLVPGAPLRGRGLPLIVISHGNGGYLASHADTALALAEAGFIVAAPTHPGDNYRDQSGAADLGGRTRQFAAVVAYMAGPWNPGAVAPERIGAFGFSAGGFTVLAAAGGMPDFGRVAPHCAAHPDFFDCRLIGAAAQAAAPQVTRSAVPLRALVVAAPALGFAFLPGSLDAVAMPVQLWQAAEDEILRAPFYVEPVRAALPRPPEFHRVQGAGHFDFLAPCNAELARVAAFICASAPGFDRAAFHARFNAEVVRFLTEALRP